IQICTDCETSLKNDKRPLYSLANFNMRGSLPYEFHDVTFAEEMVCAIYHHTAHVSRIFQSSDERDSRKLHGNTCAFEANVVDVAKKLPRPPSNVCDYLTVVFVGPGKLKKEDIMKSPHYRVRRPVIQKLLFWLQRHSALYSAYPPDPFNLDQYPEDGVLPGLIDNVVYDQ
ncbi:hypothetical protein K435DRAFT_583954, partial [Dendrothele bispora CBS 962.96]